MHDALQTYASKGTAPAVKRFKAEYKRRLPKVKEGYGGLWEGVEQLYGELDELGEGMLHNYELFAEAQGMEMTTINLEQRVWVSIMRREGWSRKNPEEAELPIKLTARFDRMVAIDNNSDDLYIVDYKTGSSTGTGRTLDLNDQASGYSYIYWRLTDEEEIPAGVIFEKLLKKIPEEPRILKNGKLSTAKNQNTLPDLYEAKMREMGLMKSAEHLECLDALRAEGWDGYFERELTSRNLQQILSYEEHLFFTVSEMQAVVRDPRKAYPSPSSMRCPRCPFQSVCLAMEDGSDYESLIAARYDVNLEKRW